MTASNEGKCLDAVLRILERELSVSRRVLARDTPDQPGVELICMLGEQRYALEHTIIEPFPDNRKDDVRFLRVFDGFENDVLDLLNPALSYHLHVPVYAFEGMTRRETVAARKAIVTWTQGALSRLPEPTSYRETTLSAAPPEVPVPVRLASHRSPGHGGQLTVNRFAPEPLESLRRKRLLQSLKGKGPKLHAAREPGTRTVLVLENGDIALTNEGQVSELVDELSREVQCMPDDVYLVGTYIKDRFYVTQVRRDGKACLETGDESWGFDAASLQDI